jgi:hypothetical protein
MKRRRKRGVRSVLFCVLMRLKRRVLAADGRGARAKPASFQTIIRFSSFVGHDGILQQPGSHRKDNCERLADVSVPKLRGILYAERFFVGLIDGYLQDGGCCHI